MAIRKTAATVDPGSRIAAPATVMAVAAIVIRGWQRTVTAYRHRPETIATIARYPDEMADGITALVTMTASVEATQAESGNRVRSASGAQVTKASSTTKPVSWWPRWALSCVSTELATAKQISAVITSAISTRSNRPRRSQRWRGVGGFVVSVTNVAAKLRTAFTFMPPA